MVESIGPIQEPESDADDAQEEEASPAEEQSDEQSSSDAQEPASDDCDSTSDGQDRLPTSNLTSSHWRWMHKNQPPSMDSGSEAQEPASDDGDSGSDAQEPPANEEPQEQPVTPVINISGSAGGSEGVSVTFTVPATPAPRTDLTVSVTVAVSGDFGVSAGDRTLTIPTGGSATLSLTTADDSADESDGSVTLTLNAGDGHSIGALASETVAVLDNDEPAQQEQSQQPQAKQQQTPSKRTQQTELLPRNLAPRWCGTTGRQRRSTR
ncbi:MAG: hypothetical protein F4Y69_12250 [Chloroflexi bacterium]|nr:hypothetical protein [Chloroflexota bacterium]MYF22732.1 hypothetical protein [Chloroflexota bacterium]